jgi:hypothetical protein
MFLNRILIEQGENMIIQKKMSATMANLVNLMWLSSHAELKVY